MNSAGKREPVSWSTRANQFSLTALPCILGGFVGSKYFGWFSLEVGMGMATCHAVANFAGDRLHAKLQVRTFRIHEKYWMTSGSWWQSMRMTLIGSSTVIGCLLSPFLVKVVERSLRFETVLHYHFAWGIGLAIDRPLLLAGAAILKGGLGLCKGSESKN
jgi:hypothetical protein